MSSAKMKKSNEQNKRNIINTFLKGGQRCWLWSAFLAEVIAYQEFDSEKNELCLLSYCGYHTLKKMFCPLDITTFIVLHN